MYIVCTLYFCNEWHICVFYHEYCFYHVVMTTLVQLS